MTEEPSEIGKFGFGLKILRKPDGSILYQIQSANENVPTEIVIMQLKSFLKKLEKEYFSKTN